MSKSHQPCPDCGSSDALTINDNGSTYCHSANHQGKRYTPPKGGFSGREETTTSQNQKQYAPPKSDRGAGVPERCLSPPTMARYGAVRSGDAIHFVYTDGSGTLSAKVRSLSEKNFYVAGPLQQALLYGQDRFPAGSAKAITITEGEFDALAVYQIQGSQYPVVSVKNGAGSALRDAKEQYNYLNSFETIVVNFDNDEAGQKAAREVCALFPEKSKNLCLTEYKDANDYLMHDKAQAYMKEWWAAPSYRPDCLINGKDMYDQVMADISLPFVNFPWDGLNLMTYGVRPGEIVTMTAGSGSGKSTFIKCILEHILNKNDKVKMGVLSLEESAATAALTLMSIHSNKSFHLPTKQQMKDFVLNDPDNIVKKGWLPDEVTQEEKDDAFKAVLGTGRFIFYDSGGNVNVNDVVDTMAFMARVDGCNIIVLDHISILVGMQQAATYGNEREAIDECMHKLRRLVENTGCTVLLVSHLRRGGQDSTAHEEGGRVSTNQLRGSQAIAQLSNIAIGIERDSQHEDELERNTSTIRVLKNRFSGETGIACKVRWDRESGRLNEVEDKVPPAL